MPLRLWQKIALGIGFALLIAFAIPVEARSALLGKRMGDLDCFLRAAWAVRSGADLYAVTDDNGFHYNYPPFLAVLATPLADPPTRAGSLVAVRCIAAGATPATGSLDATVALASADVPLVPDEPPVIPFLPFAVSVGLVYCFNLACLFFAVHLLAGLLDQAPRGCFRWWALRVWPALVLLVPIGHTLMRGQSNLFVLALLSAALGCWTNGQRFRGGVWLAAAACLKIFPAFLFLLPLWRRDLRGLAGGAVGLLLCLGVVPLVALGPQRTALCYLRLGQVLVLPGLGAGGDDSRADELTNVTATDSQSLLAALHNNLHFKRATRPDQVSRTVRLTSYLLGGVLTALTFAAAGWQPWRDPVAFTLLLGLLSLDMILLCPVCHLHYFTLAVPVVTGLLADRWQAHPTWGVFPGIGLLGLFLVVAIANLLPHIPSLIVLREGGLATVAALSLWSVGCRALWRRRSSKKALPFATEYRAAA